uniref:Phage tail tape measure protein domain-containing protein n=2 Tax=Rhizobium leguminosarum TaxID=384 RepID=A0A154IHB3_RHILE|nr:hypothetical protein A4A59_19500 [Rhizobium leguminosarum]
MATQESKLRVSLIDDVTRRAKTITGALGMLQRQTSPVSGLIGRVAAFGGAYLGVNTAIENGFKPAANLQAAMTEIGIKADLSQTQLAQLGARLRSLAPRVNQTTEALTGGVDTMLTMGLAAGDAQMAIDPVGKAATATGAAIEDLSSASVSAIQNLKVAPGLIQQMLDGMAAAGNAGAFELKDMAQYFPQLTASAQTLGMEGVPAINDIAAALQIARRGAGDASTAANNLSDFMGKIMTPQTIKNFKKFGVDVTKELQNAHKKGISPIEHFIKLIDEKTKGGQGDLLTQIFGDKQTLDFIRPMIAGFKDYIRIRDQADRANGTIADAYSRRMQDANQKIKAAQIALGNLGTAIGANFLGPVGEGAQHLADILNTLDERVTIFDKLKASATGFLSGLGIGSGEFKELAQDIELFFVGSADASKAADDYGRLFGRFREWGASVRSFYDQVKDNPILKFFEQMSGYGLQLALWSAGFAMLAGTIRKLAGAIALLTGITSAVSIIKSLGKIGGVVADVSGMPGFGKSNAPSGGKAIPEGMPLLAGWGAWLKGFSAQSMIGAIPQILGDTPGSTFEEQVENQRQFREGILKLLHIDDPLKKPDPYPDLGSRVGSVLGLDQANRGRNYGFPGTTDTLPGKRADDAVSLTAESISAISRPTGVQDVKVTNPIRPNVTQSFTLHINGATDPKAVADAVQQQLGKAAKSAVEESFGGGGGF